MSRKKREGVEFVCIHCGLKETYEEYVPPANWYKQNYARKGEYRQLCRCCGSFMYPSVWGPKTPEERKRLFEMFSICRNAPACFEKGIYRPDCEKQNIKPDCLYILFEQVADVSSRLHRLEKHFSLNAQKPGQSPTSKDQKK